MSQGAILESPPDALPLPTSKSKGRWQELVSQKQRELELDLPVEWRLPDDILGQFRPTALTDAIKLNESDILRKVPFFSEAELEITESNSAVSLVGKLAKGELSAHAVTTAFCKRAAIAGQLLSCLTETFYQQALDRAQYLDDYLKREGRPFGPLHGLPISIKDTFDVKGKQSTGGFVAMVEKPPADTNAPLVDILLDLGAVLYVKTNIPQTMMTADSENHIFGRTLNPLNTSINAGGSSGGEGSLVAFKGSPLGVGTDIAGSIRIPSSCCGVYGFKPTADRVPLWGHSADRYEFMMPGIPGIPVSAGPIGRTLEDLELFMSSVLDAQPWNYDVQSFAAPWTRVSLQPLAAEVKLTIGIVAEHPQIPLHPPVRRAYESAIAQLKKKGHRIVDIPSEPPTDIAYGSRLAFEYYCYGPRKGDLMAASGEPPVRSVANQANPMFTGDFPVDMKLDLGTQIDELWKASNSYADAWRKLWVENKLDAILTPGAHSTAVAHDTWGWPFYTVMWNVTNFPAIIIPYGKASKELDPEPEAAANSVQPGYNPDAVDGAPCAIQVVAPRFQDEKCLWAAKVIDRDIRC